MSKFVCNNPICENFDKEISENDIIENSLGESCCPACKMPVEDKDAPVSSGGGLGGPPNSDSGSKKRIIIIAAIVVIAIIAGVIFMLNSGEAEPTPEEQVVEKVVEPVKTDSKTPAGTQSLTFDGGSKYVGEVKDAKMHGLGNYYYGQKERISQKDLKKRMAEKGDYISGEFFEGNIVSGKLYDSQNNLKEVIMIGR
ncbi:hypothetical protein ACXR6G_18260 [Ancylomarina sp. YFZ004]